jgi:hypothetical protein
MIKESCDADRAGFVSGDAIEVFLKEYVKFKLTADNWTLDLHLKQRAEAIAKGTTSAADGTVKAEHMDSSMASGSLYQGTVWSDDEDEAEEDRDQVEEVAKETIALEEAKKVLKNWKKLEVYWLVMYPDLAAKKKAGESLDLTEDLMRLDIGTVYKHVGHIDTGKQLFGEIPAMASSSVGQLGALSAESFCERILSCANNVIHKGNTLLSDDELEMLVVLRMNREFMRFMREFYSNEAKQEFGQTVVRDV